MTAAIRRRCWARAMIHRATGPIPRYGSPEWAALPEGHFAKIAAVVRAAEAWARETVDDLEQNLRAEVAQLQHAHKAAEDADYAAGIQAHREQWAHLSSPKHVSLVGLYGGQAIPPRDPYDIGREHSTR